MFPEKDIEALLNTNYPPDCPGGAVIVVKDGQILHRAGYGLANMELKVPVEPETVFKIGSVTKQFTAASILMLVEEGKLALDDPISKFMPDYPTHGHTISIEHLLTHTSGIKSMTSIPDWPFSKDLSTTEVIDGFKLKPMDFAPGTGYEYNNSAYFILGAVIAKLSDGTYEDFLQKRIFDPLGMKQTYGYTAQHIIPRRASGYNKSGDGFQNCAYISMTHPGAAGVLSSTVDDLSRWDACLYTDQLLKPASLERAWKPYTLKDGSSTHYGYGWAIEECAGRKWIGHSGGIHGFLCSVVRIPQERLFIAVLTNLMGAEKTPDEVAFRLTLLSLGIPVQEPQPVKLSPASLERLSGVYEIKPGEERHFKVKEGKFMHCMPVYEFEEELLPASESEFFPKENVFYRFRFTPNESGAVAACQVFNPYGRLLDTARKTEKPLPE